MSAGPPAAPLSGLAPPRLPDGETGRQVLRAMLRGRSPLAALEAMHAALGDVFRIPLPGFSPVVLVGPEANRFVTVTGRADLRWRSEGDPVTRLLRRGVLVTDGELHDDLRHTMNPALHRSTLPGQVEAMVRRTDQVTAAWAGRRPIDMLVEMRKVALLILMETLFGVDFTPDLPYVWPALLRTLAYISPGAWVVWPQAPRPGYGWALRRMDRYLYGLIAARRANPGPPTDLLGRLVAAPHLDDDLVRDQLLTILIAGHDTSTALLAWSLYLLGAHPPVLAQAQAEVDAVIGQAAPELDTVQRLQYLGQVIDEALRLYPPIHIGNRIAAVDLEFNGFAIPAGTRVVYSIYLTHRHPGYWPEPARFDPGRFSPEAVRLRPHYAFVPFGSGPRNCIGMAYAQVEVKVVLARLLQQYHLALAPGAAGRIHAHMGATLEPRPGVAMIASPRPRGTAR